ncbi:MAG TPA: hypothetical protein PKI81_13225, partial [bacterium]|nr:hypothetical protein [bacterium]
MNKLISILLLGGMLSAGAQPNPVLLVSPQQPVPGKSFRVLAAWDADPGMTQIVVTGPEGALRARTSREGSGLPGWRCDSFQAGPAGRYHIALKAGRTVLASCEVEITPMPVAARQPAAGVWENRRAWGRE